MIIKTTELKRSFEVGSETVEAIKGINLEVSAGEFLAITGPSGSGKTTLMNIIGCLDTPTSGEYFLNNKLVNELNENGYTGGYGSSQQEVIIGSFLAAYTGKNVNKKSHHFFRLKVSHFDTRT